MTTNREDQGQAQDPLERQGNQAKLDAVAASPLEAAPESQTDGQGTSFYNPALTGSGTIMPDGTYGAPLPDPNLEKRRELTTEAEEADGTTGPKVTKVEDPAATSAQAEDSASRNAGTTEEKPARTARRTSSN
jgi:hypothetical protein